MIAIIDYGMGNVGSVLNALSFLKASATITRNAADIARASHIILPGVGAFGEGMDNLKKFGLIPVLERAKEMRKPFLGICLGMQLFASFGEEGGIRAGLGWIPGRTRRLTVDETELRIPHVGWDDVSPKEGATLFKDVSPRIFYFVHSFHFAPEDAAAVSATCAYGETFTAAVQKDTLLGVQFHPEKSQRSGLRVLKNFLEYA